MNKVDINNASYNEILSLPLTKEKNQKIWEYVSLSGRINTIYDLVQVELLSIKDIDYDNSKASYFSEHIRRELEVLDETLDINIYEDGLNINTTLDMGIHSIVQDAFNEVMIKNQKIFLIRFFN